MELKSIRASISYLTSQNIWLSIFFFFKNTVVLNYFFYLILTLSERPNIVRVRKGQGRLVYNLSPHAINLSDIILYTDRPSPPMTPDQGGKNLRRKTQKICKETGSNWNFN